MPNTGQLTGMRGVYLVAAELAARGLIAVPTSRSARGADILVTDQDCKKSFSVQVKTNARTFSFWLLNASYKDMHSETHIYVFVNIRETKKISSIEYYIVPSKKVAELGKTDKAKKADSIWHAINLKDIVQFKDSWDTFLRI